jgi:hypothetical protein
MLWQACFWACLGFCRAVAAAVPNFGKSGEVYSGPRRLGRRWSSWARPPAFQPWLDDAEHASAAASKAICDFAAGLKKVLWGDVTLQPIRLGCCVLLEFWKPDFTSSGMQADEECGTGVE